MKTIEMMKSPEEVNAVSAWILLSQLECWKQGNRTGIQPPKTAQVILKNTLF